MKSSVVAAQRALDRATTAKHAADDEQARLAGEKQAADATLAAARSGAPNPATGAPYTVAEIEQLTSVASTAAQSAAQATQTALDAAWDLVKGWTVEDHDYLRSHTPRTGLATKFQGRPLSELGREVVEIAHAGIVAVWRSSLESSSFRSTTCAGSWNL